MNPKWMQMLGLAMRANKLVAGEELVLKAVRSSQVKLVILSEDASGNTAKRVKDKCQSYHIPLLQGGSRGMIGHSIGKEERVVIGVLDAGFAEQLQKKFNLDL